MQYEEQYIFVFASNYHGYYIEELLKRHNIKCTLRKAPRAVGKSCNTAIYISEKDLEKAVGLIKQGKTTYQGLYKISIAADHTTEYVKINM
ncbi:DUF3343 domain-containing protein [Thermotalea metallivorans]|uniref:Putative Se/S carrier protein-like domain-containing protein n=1 Tax=Thermotalea metallivorans TaxID=520762 RepID=A0A140L0I4_9FIRM|nr:DUF3343 domain-containing protein [Thermotalea metallivorans]KXG74059.1 hypothetical protein AN619_26690 [Thermotalea metallivorans]